MGEEDNTAGEIVVLVAVVLVTVVPAVEVPVEATSQMTHHHHLISCALHALDLQSSLALLLQSF